MPAIWLQPCERQAAASPHSILSGPGIGKTDTVIEGASILSAALGKNIGVCVIDCSLLSIDAMGFVNLAVVSGRNVSQYTYPPNWITSEGKFLDEFEFFFFVGCHKRYG